MAKELHGFCPNCGVSLYYSDGEQTWCPNCETEVTPRATWDAERREEASAFGASDAMIVGVDNPESALVYLENFYENFNWEAYAETTEIVPAAISAMVEKNKVRNGASANTWLLSFKSMAYPVFKKIEGLGKLERQMAEKYNTENNDAALKIFDSYRRVVKALIEKKDELVKRLENDIRYAERFGLDEGVRAQIKGELDNIVRSLGALKEVGKLSDVSAYNSAKTAEDKKKAAEFFAKGIDAASVYKEAVAKFEDGDASNIVALELFESIRGYSDSAEYINKINKYFNFNYEFIDYMGKKFIFKKERYTLNLGDLKKKKGGCSPFKKKDAASADAPAPIVKDCLSLYAITDGFPEKKPLVKGINQIINCYAGRVYFFKSGEGVAYYDITSGETVVLDSGHDEDYLNGNGNYECYLNAQGYTFSFKKRIAIKSVKGGCLRKKKIVANENNYSLISVDMRNNHVKTFIEELVDTSERYENSVFYIHATVTEPEKKKGCFNAIKKLFKKPQEEERKIDTSLNVCDLTTGECKKLLDEGCEIHNVRSGKVIYSTWAPNEYNIDLCSYDLATDEVTLIEKNVRSYFGVISGMIYYTVGNEWHAPLIRNSFDGKDRLEVMSNVDSVIGEYGGWIYIKRGKGRNAVLSKITADGKERVYVCSQFKQFVTISDTVIYYVDTADRLCSVRTDGKDCKVISSDVDKIVSIGDDSIYYSSHELVDRNKYSNSIYCINSEGKDTKKLVFDVANTQNYDDNTFYYSKKARVRYKVTVPTSKKKTETRYEFLDIAEYFVYDKRTGESTQVLTLGLPNVTAKYKAGCFGKTAEGEVIYEKAPLPREYRRKGLEATGSVAEKQIEEAKTAEANVSAAKLAKKKAANSKNGGCFKKIPIIGPIIGAVFGIVISILAIIPIIGKPFKAMKRK